MPSQPSEPFTPPIVVVGVGEDGLAGVSSAAREAVERAEVLIGAPRQLALVREDAGVDAAVPAVAWPSPLLPGLASTLHPHRGSRIVVLASGNPLYHGIASTLIRECGSASVKVVPTISSVTLACAYLGWKEDVTPVVSLVTRDAAEVVRYADAGGRFVVLCRSAASVAAVAAVLKSLGHSETRLIALSNLGGPRQAVSLGSVAEPPVAASDLTVLAVDPVGARPPTRSLLPGLDDGHYATTRGQLTKQDVRALSVCALAPRPGELLWDIGGGSGSIAIEWLRSTPGVTARCFEADEHRAELISSNAERLGVPHLKISGAAPLALQDRVEAGERPDVVFIGGGLTAPGVAEAAWAALKPGGRLVANAVTVESEQALWALRRQYGGRLVRLAVDTEHAVGSFTTFKPALPVTQWRVTKDQAEKDT